MRLFQQDAEIANSCRL